MEVRSVEETIMRRQRYRMIGAAVAFFVAIATILMGYWGVAIMLFFFGLFLMYGYLYYSARSSGKARMYHLGKVTFGFLFVLQVAVTVIFLLFNYWGGR